MPDWVLQLVAIAGTGAAAYAAIRSDLAALHVKAQMAVEAAGEAHRRIDHMIGKK